LSKNNKNSLFNFLAPIFGIMYNRQKKHYAAVVEKAKPDLDLSGYSKVIDVGCGTGALCAVLSQNGSTVTGVDPASRMIEIARKKSLNKGVTFIQANVLEKLPFEDKYFDVSIASYVAHGLPPEKRKFMYTEMARITKHRVVIYDYNQKRSFPITVAEWFERGDYFNFIQNAESEMKSCVFGKRKCFSEVKVLNVDVQAAWYICTPG
jgi:ubiquinone/menaquinone biosynthesis C-methylase UbiE